MEGAQARGQAHAHLPCAGGPPSGAVPGPFPAGHATRSAASAPLPAAPAHCTPLGAGRAGCTPCTAQQRAGLSSCRVFWLVRRRASERAELAPPAPLNAAHPSCSPPLPRAAWAARLADSFIAAGKASPPTSLPLRPSVPCCPQAALSDARAGDLIELAPDTTFAPTVVDAAAPYGENEARRGLPPALRPMRHAAAWEDKSCRAWARECCRWLLAQDCDSARLLLLPANAGGCIRARGSDDCARGARGCLMSAPDRRRRAPLTLLRGHA